MISRTALFRLAGRLFAGPAPGNNPIRRLLVLKPDHFGDVLLAGPALHLLRTRLPDASITLAVGPRGEAIASRLPGIDRVVVVPFPGLDPLERQAPSVRWGLLARLASRWLGRYDAGLLLRDDYYWGALLLAAARMPVRAGTATDLCAPFLTHSVSPVRRSAAAHHLHVASLLVPGDSIPDHWTPRHRLRLIDGGAADLTADLRARAGLAQQQSYALLHPGSGAVVKLWTAAGWATVARALRDRWGLQTLVVAGAGEQHLIPPIVRRAGGAAIAFPAAPNLDTLCSLMRPASLVLGVDSGPLHLAAALDVPSVRLYGPIDPSVYGPWGDPCRHRWIASTMLCAPCDRLHWDLLDLPWHPCVRRIPPDALLREVELVLTESLPRLSP